MIDEGLGSSAHFFFHLASCPGELGKEQESKGVHKDACRIGHWLVSQVHSPIPFGAQRGSKRHRNCLFGNVTCRNGLFPRARR